jgi:hypothetical protein
MLLSSFGDLSHTSILYYCHIIHKATRIKNMFNKVKDLWNQSHHSIVTGFVQKDIRIK